MSTSVRAPRDDGITIVSLQIEDVRAATAWPCRHADPFERVLIAQAQRRAMTLLRHDADIRRYGVATRDPMA